MLLRRGAAIVTAALLLCSGAAPAALAAPSPSEEPPAAGPDALYGTEDPTYDGVWRQSLTLLAQHAAGLTPAKEAVRWLVDQQCADGSFAAYRAQPDQPCDSKTAIDTNATGAAVQALAAVGDQRKVVDSALTWLREQQNEDGGWGYSPGDPSDANSLSVVIGALAAAGEDPAKVWPAAGGEGQAPSAYDALAGFQLGCDAAKAERGAFAYQPDEKSGDLDVNDAATVAAIPAALGQGLFVDRDGARPADTAPQPLDCPGDAPEADTEPVDTERVAEGGAAYLAATLKANDQHLVSVLPGSDDQPDYGNTTLAVLALAAGGHQEAARQSLAWLERHTGDWDQLAKTPAALAYLVLASHALGSDTTDFGGLDLVASLNSTGPAPSAGPSDKGTDAAKDKDRDENAADDGNGGVVLGVLIAAVVLAAAVAVVWRLRSRAARRS